MSRACAHPWAENTTQLQRTGEPHSDLRFLSGFHKTSRAHEARNREMLAACYTQGHAAAVNGKEILGVC